LLAIHNLKGHRTLRWGPNLDLIITDERSYRSEDPFGRPEADNLGNREFSELAPEELMEMRRPDPAWDMRVWVAAT